MAARQRMCTRGHGSFKDDDPRNVTKRAWRARNGGPAAGQRTGRPMALRQTTAERGGSRGATAGTDRAGCGPMVEVPRCFVSTLKAGVFLSAQTGLETALLAGRPHRGMECRQRLRTRGVEAPGTADWDAVCADARKTPPKRARGVSRNPLPTPGPLLPMAHESLISRKTGAEVPLTGLSFFSAKHRRQREPGISELPVRIVWLFPPACAHENSGVFVTRSGGGRTREPGPAERRGFPTDRRRD
jgi:hypothetical protein